jgi:hypothetical protein
VCSKEFKDFPSRGKHKFCSSICSGIAKHKYFLCVACGIQKTHEDFYGHKNRPSGKRCVCKDCSSVIQKEKSKKPHRRETVYKSSARSRGHEYTLTHDEFVGFWQKPCSYCGSEIETIGLDRVDSFKGYTLNNVVPCCMRCNRMKMDMTKEQFLNHIKKISELQNHLDCATMVVGGN